MKILFLGANSSSTKFSISQFLDGLESKGHDCVVKLNPVFKQFKYLDFKGGRKINNFLYNFPRLFILRIRDAIIAKNYDVVFLHQYYYHPMKSPFLELLLRKYSKRFVFYFFDPIWNNAQKTDSALVFKLSQIIKVSDHVIVANQYLANFAFQFNSNITILPMTVNLSVYSKRINTFGNKIVFGYCGGPYNYIYLKELIPVFDYFQKNNFNVEFRVISGKSLPDYLLGYGIKYVRWTPENEVEELRKINVGIVPLTDDDWTRGKFSIKLIQHMAVGSPVICSNVGVNPEVIQNGFNGYVVDSINEWIEKIKLISSDLKLRNKLSENAYQCAHRKYSHLFNLNEYIGVFNRLMSDFPDNKDIL